MGLAGKVLEAQDNFSIWGDHRFTRAREPVNSELYHEMKMQNEDKCKTEKLISEILRMADFAKIYAEDSSAWQELKNEAKTIEESGDDDSALVAFHDFAAHWKGLRDIYFPEKQK